jgi:hypothetical protein
VGGADQVSYAGVAFPGVLHARWALFFDSLGMTWRFRPAAFTLGSGVRYQPDFWLPVHQTWVQVEDDAADDDDDDDDDLRVWREFALAADRTGHAAHLLAEFDSGDDEDLADLDEDVLESVLNARSNRPLPLEWQADNAVYSVGGIPDPAGMDPFGPRYPAHPGSMITLGDSCYQWARCPTCGFVGAEYCGRADRLACGHGDRRRDKDYRADDPPILAAFALARRATAARYGGGCAGCEDPIERRALVVHGPPVGRRHWYHAECPPKPDS